jgi:L-lactate permease
MQVLTASFTQHYTPRRRQHPPLGPGRRPALVVLLVAIVVFGMPVTTAAAATNGAAFGLFPIGWIVLCAIFVYDIIVKTGRETWRLDDDPPVEEERAGGRRPGPATGELSPGPGAATQIDISPVLAAAPTARAG